MSWFNTTAFRIKGRSVSFAAVWVIFWGSVAVIFFARGLWFSHLANQGIRERTEIMDRLGALADLGPGEETREKVISGIRELAEEIQED